MPAKLGFRGLVGGACHPLSMGKVILGGEAVKAGVVTRHELQRSYAPLYRGVYVRRGAEVTLRDRTIGAWLATGRRGVVAGVAASASFLAPLSAPGVPLPFSFPNMLNL